MNTPSCNQRLRTQLVCACVQASARVDEGNWAGLSKNLLEPHRPSCLWIGLMNSGFLQSAFMCGRRLRHVLTNRSNPHGHHSHTNKHEAPALGGEGASSLQGYSEHAINTEGIAVAPQGEGHRKACEGRPHRRSAESDGSGAAREWKMIQPPSIQKEK